MGLGAEYQQMTDEINKVLYGGDPIKMGMSVSQIQEIDDDVQQRLNKNIYCEMCGITSDEQYADTFKRDLMLLYDPNNFSVGKDGTLPDDVQIYQSLSQYGLTDQKTSIISTISGEAVFGGIRYQDTPANTRINAYEYLSRAHDISQALWKDGSRSAQAYLNYKTWNENILEMYSNYSYSYR
jgi:hypothetical protein